MRRVFLLFASRACHCHFLSLVNARQWSPRKDQALHSIGSFRPFLLAFFFLFCQLTIHNRALRLSVCRELQAADEKNLTPQRHVFSRPSQYMYPYGERTFEEGKSTNRIVHVGFPTSRTPSVDLRFRSFSINPVESTRSSLIGFSFLDIFASPLKQK